MSAWSAGNDTILWRGRQVSVDATGASTSWEVKGTFRFLSRLLHPRLITLGFPPTNSTGPFTCL